MPETEILLEGGNTSTGVVRIADTVRKNMTKNSPTTHRLLKHLETKGFTSCPQFLGIDSKGREITSFIDGDTVFTPFIWTSDECLISTVKILRKYHDATIDFPHSKSDQWAYSYPDETRHEVIGHSDFAPYNFIYREKLPAAAIDFDLAGPAPRLRDLAYCAYWNVPLSINSPDMKSFAIADLDHNCRRLKLLCETYGVLVTEELLEMVEEVLDLMGNEAKILEMIGPDATRNLRDGGHLDHWKNELLAFKKHRNEIASHLLRY